MRPSRPKSWPTVPRKRPRSAKLATSITISQSSQVNPRARCSALALLLAACQILSLCGVQLALTPFTWLLEVLMAAQVRHDACLLTLLLETTQGALEGLTVLHPDTGQEIPPSLPFISRMVQKHNKLAPRGVHKGAKLARSVYGGTETQSSTAHDRCRSGPRGPGGGTPAGV